MPEILTESFCERCGTRYTFESAAPRAARLKGIRVMSRGLRNFVMSDDSSMDEAMAAARNETDREQTTQQLDAFHKTFNFCMSCRQYTCGNCWNEAEVRCLSCAPNLGQEIMPAPFGDLGAGGAVTLTDSEAVGLHDRNGHEVPAAQAPLSWPTSDLMREDDNSSEPDWASATPRPAAAAAEESDEFDFVARLATLGGSAAPATEPIEAPAESVAEPEEAVAESAESVPVAEEPVGAAVPELDLPPMAPEVVPAAEAVASAPEQVDDRAAAAAANTSDLLQRFRPGESLDDEIEAFEREHGATDLGVATPVVVPVEPTMVEPETVAPEPQPEPIAAPPIVAAPEPEPIAVAPEPERIAVAPEPEPVAPIAAAFVIAEPEPESEPVATEPIVAAPEPEPVAPEPIAAAFVIAEPELEPFAPEPIAAAPEPEPEPAPQPPEPLSEPVAASAEPRDDIVAQPTWQVVAPDPTADAVAAPPVPETPPSVVTAASVETEWPTQPEWPAREAPVGLPFFGRPPAATGGIDALWAESAREVAQVTPPGAPKVGGGVQPCVSCGLSLSANARFCRRCGTRQG